MFSWHAREIAAEHTHSGFRQREKTGHNERLSLGYEHVTLVGSLAAGTRRSPPLPFRPLLAGPCSSVPPPRWRTPHLVHAPRLTQRLVNLFVSLFEQGGAHILCNAGGAGGQGTSRSERPAHRPAHQAGRQLAGGSHCRPRPAYTARFAQPHLSPVPSRRKAPHSQKQPPPRARAAPPQAPGRRPLLRGRTSAPFLFRAQPPGAQIQGGPAAARRLPLLCEP